MSEAPQCSETETTNQQELFSLDKLEAELATLYQIAMTLSQKAPSNPDETTQTFIKEAAETLPRAIAAIKSLNVQRSAIIKKRLESQRHQIQENIS